MKNELFAELLESVREGGAILRARREPARALHVGELDVRALRETYGLTQAKFAALMGISVATLRNWEQGRRRPEGSARILLHVVATHPEAVLDVVSAESNRPGRRVKAEVVSRRSVPATSRRGRRESRGARRSS